MATSENFRTIYFMSKNRSSKMTDDDYQLLNQKYKIEIHDVTRSYIKELFLDATSSIVIPYDKEDKLEYYNKECLVFKSPDVEPDMDNFLELLQDNILNAPFTRVPIYEKVISQGCKIFVFKFPDLNDLQVNYIYELLSVIKNKVIELSEDDNIRTDIFEENLENDGRGITLEYFIRYHNITEIGIEKYDEDVYLTFSVYGDCNIEFDKIRIKEVVEIDGEDEEIENYGDMLEIDENGGFSLVSFEVELTKI